VKPILPRLISSQNECFLKDRSCGVSECAGTGKEQRVQVRYREGVAIHIGPEPCADVRKGVGEASLCATFRQLCYLRFYMRCGF
jgi:hypothetical protein